jgi:hypothetical protein
LDSATVDQDGSIALNSMGPDNPKESLLGAHERDTSDSPETTGGVTTRSNAKLSMKSEGQKETAAGSSSSRAKGGKAKKERAWIDVLWILLQITGLFCTVMALYIASLSNFVGMLSLSLASSFSTSALNCALTVGLEDTFGKRHCQNRLKAGHWRGPTGPQLPPGTSSIWQTDTCMTAKYSANEISKCLGNTTIVMTGDSTMRSIYYALTSRLIPKVNTTAAPHSDHEFLYEKGNITLTFYWNPWLNRTDVDPFVSTKKSSRNSFSQFVQRSSGKSITRRSDENGENSKYRADISIFAVGAGFWHVRYGQEVFKSANASLSNYQNMTEKLVNKLNTWHNTLNDMHQRNPYIYFRLMHPVVESLLSDARKHTLTNERLAHYNAYLFDFLHETGNNRTSTDNTLDYIPVPKASVAMIMAAPDKSLDGLHYARHVDDAEVDALLNEACNPILYDSTIQDKTTCCISYPEPRWETSLILIICGVLGPLVWILRALIRKWQDALIISL